MCHQSGAQAVCVCVCVCMYVCVCVCIRRRGSDKSTYKGKATLLNYI